MSTTNNRRRKWLRIAGVITGLVGAGAGTFFWWLLFAFATLGGTTYEPDMGIVVPATVGAALLLFGSVALAWWRPVIGGTMLIVLGSLGIIFLRRLFLVEGAALLASGVLFLLSWREGRKQQKEADG